MHISKGLKALAVIALATVALQSPVQGQGGRGGAGGQAAAGFKMDPIRPGKVFLINGGTNAYAIIGKTGVVVVDSKTNKKNGEDIMKAVATVTSLPVTHVILTHSDCDHANGIAGIPANIPVIATKRNLIELKQTLRFGTIETQGIGNGMPDPNRLPTMLIDQEKTDTTIDGIHMILYYWGPAHTSGDLVIFLPDEKVAITGDYLMNSAPEANGLPPQQHGLWWKFEKNGSPAGWLKGANNLLALNADTYLGGHGEKPFTKAQVRELRDGMKADMEKIDAMAAAGKTLDEIQTAFNDKAYAIRSALPYNLNPPRECPRGIGYMPLTFQEYHEWLNKHEEFKGGTL
jgi:glyoxylase-like metal-dependent hydrolase (beta-lactamase superfamily II)